MYLEELSDHIEEVSVECQTDMFLDKPDTPFFVPAKSGRDAATQIEEGEVQCQLATFFFYPLVKFDVTRHQCPNDSDSDSSFMKC